MSVLLYPPFLQWELCSECNHKCIHCYNYWRADNIPVEQCENYLNIADKIIERKPLYVAITGGEPLLVFPKVKEIVITTSDNFNDIGVLNNLLNMFGGDTNGI